MCVSVLSVLSVCLVCVCVLSVLSVLSVWCDAQPHNSCVRAALMTCVHHHHASVIDCRRGHFRRQKTGKVYNRDVKKHDHQYNNPRLNMSKRTRIGPTNHTACVVM